MEPKEDVLSLFGANLMVFFDEAVKSKVSLIAGYGVSFEI